MNSIIDKPEELSYSKNKIEICERNALERETSWDMMIGNILEAYGEEGLERIENANDILHTLLLAYRHLALWQNYKNKIHYWNSLSEESVKEESMYFDMIASQSDTLYEELNNHLINNYPLYKE